MKAFKKTLCRIFNHKSKLTNPVGIEIYHRQYRHAWICGRCGKREVYYAKKDSEGDLAKLLVDIKSWRKIKRSLNKGGFYEILFLFILNNTR